MSDMCSHAFDFEHSLQGNTVIWLKETENNKKLCGQSDNQVSGADPVPKSDCSMSLSLVVKNLQLGAWGVL